MCGPSMSTSTLSHLLLPPLPSPTPIPPSPPSLHSHLPSLLPSSSIPSLLPHLPSPPFSLSPLLSPLLPLFLPPSPLLLSHRVSGHLCEPLARTRPHVPHSAEAWDDGFHYTDRCYLSEGRCDLSTACILIIFNPVDTPP